MTEATKPPIIARETSPTEQATKGILIIEENIGNGSIMAYIKWKNPQLYNMMLFPYFNETVEMLFATYSVNATTLISGNKELRFPIYTEYNREGVVFRAHNNYKSEGPWIDWCKVDWRGQDEGEGVGQLLVFLEVPDKGLCAIIYPCSINDRKDHGILTDLWPMEWQPGTRKPWLQIATVDSLQYPVLMLSYKGRGLRPSDNRDWWLEVHDRDTWADKFQPID